MTSTVAPSPVPARHAPIASWRHTLVLAGLFLTLAIAGFMFQARGASKPTTSATRPDLTVSLLALTAMEWGLLIYVWRSGLKSSGASLSALIGGRWKSARDVVTDVVLAAAVWGTWLALQRGLEVLDHAPAVSIESLLPRTLIERLAWIGLSISAGFCEEVVFRGYFQRQFEALTQSWLAALVLQALLFGVSHGYQGWSACVRITAFAVLFSVGARLRGHLRPGMIAHAWTDIAAGLLRI